MNTKTIGTRSRDYSTLLAYHTYVRGLGPLSDSQQGVRYNDSLFQETVTFNNTDATSSYNVTYTVAQGQRHNQTRGSGVTIQTDNPTSVNGTPIVIYDAWVNFEWWQIDGGNYTYNTGSCITTNYLNPGDIHIDYVFVYDTNGSSSNGIMLSGNDSTNIFVNDLILLNIPYNGLSCGNMDQCYLINCTVLNTNTINSVWGQRVNAGSSPKAVAINVASMLTGSRGQCFEGSWDASSDYNIDDDGTAPGGNSLNNKTASNQFTTTTRGSEDVRLKVGADCLQAGVGTTQTLVLPVDFLGTSRPVATCDIGAHQKTGVGPTPGPTVNIAELFSSMQPYY